MVNYTPQANAGIALLVDHGKYSQDDINELRTEIINWCNTAGHAWPLNTDQHRAFRVHHTEVVVVQKTNANPATYSVTRIEAD